MSLNLDIATLLSETRSLISKMHYVREDFGLHPSQDHIGTCIAFSDLLEMHEEFINELTNNIVAFVYSKEKAHDLVKRLVAEGRDMSSAYSELVRRAHAKFRLENVQGQFAELLIFNLLQFHFKAAPVLRKMKITTNPSLERNGADAIHISSDGDVLKLYLAECKTYDAKENNFSRAFHASLDDILDHYNNHRSELNLYAFEDFIPEPLENLTRRYLEGTLDNIEVNLVCMVVYRSDCGLKGASKAELDNCAIDGIRVSANLIDRKSVQKKIPLALTTRIHYVFLPLWSVDKTISAFAAKIRR